MGATVREDNPRVSAMLGRINALVDQPPPRRVPRDIARLARNPITFFLFIFESISVLILAGALVFAIETAPPSLAIVLAVLAAPSLVAVVASAYFLLATRNALINGRLYQGRIVRVRPLPARINSRTFFLATVEFEGRGGEKIAGRDTIDNWCSEYFLDARDRGEPVLVLHAPNPMGKVILPMKMAIGSRYD